MSVLQVAEEIGMFWTWFCEHESELFSLSEHEQEIFDELADQLSPISPDLTFEFGPVRQEEREFVISAGGVRASFPIVTALVAAAPKLDRWRIVAFRPRRRPINVVNFAGRCVHPNDVQFSLLHNGHVPGIYLFIPGFDQVDPAWKQIGYLMLDDALGEFDVGTKVALIKMFSPNSEGSEQRYPLGELRMRFDDLIGWLPKKQHPA